jgi:hypothetical protein
MTILTNTRKTVHLKKAPEGAFFIAYNRIIFRLCACEHPVEGME